MGDQHPPEIQQDTCERDPWAPVESDAFVFRCHNGPTIALTEPNFMATGAALILAGALHETAPR